MHRYASIAVVDDLGRLLLQERDEHAPVDPDRWCLPGGAVEAGEDFPTAASRELAEETGLRVPPDRLTRFGGTRFLSESCGGLDEFELFGVLGGVSEADVTCGEGRQMVFLDPDEVHALDLVPAARMQVPDVLDSPSYLQRFGGAPSRRFASVLLVDRAGALLLQERDEHPVIDPDRWGLVGGHLEPGEDFLAGALRELEEETGVRLDAADLTLHGEYRVDHREPYGSFDRMRVFAAATSLADADIDCREGRRIVFVAPGDVGALEVTSAASSVLPAFLTSDLYSMLTR